MACPSTQVYYGGGYIEEIWSWFSIGTLVVILRLALRLRTVGIRNFQGDDYLAIGVWICFVCKSVALTEVFEHGSNMDYNAETIAELSPCQLDSVTFGSRMELLAWYTYTGIIWGLKGMVLFMFSRLSFGLERPRLFNIIAATTAASYVAMFLTICLGCLPFHMNWQVKPPPPPKCSMRMHDVYVSTILNVATDGLILLIPIPALWTMKVNFSKKIGLTLLLCSGIFVIVAALLRFSFTLVGSTSENLNKWCQRETSIGIIAVNMPMLRPWFKILSKRRDHIRPPPPTPAEGSPPLSIGTVPWRRRAPAIDAKDTEKTLHGAELYSPATLSLSVTTNGSLKTPRTVSDAETLADDPENAHLEKGLKPEVTIFE